MATCTKTLSIFKSTDAEKAFNQVSWAFMLATLQHVGLGCNMLSWISATYETPKARVRANGVSSDPFLITNGTRQGCPLSPLPFRPLTRTILVPCATQSWHLRCEGKSNQHTRMTCQHTWMMLCSHLPHPQSPSPTCSGNLHIYLYIYSYFIHIESISLLVHIYIHTYFVYFNENYLFLLLCFYSYFITSTSRYSFVYM